MWYIACCDSEGKCFGFLKKNRTVSTDPDIDVNDLMNFRTRKQTNETCLQINLAHALLPDGPSYRAVAVKGK